MGTHQSIRKTVMPEIPDKLYFRIGDVARLCEVPAYVLRFWETEFPQLRPNKGGTGQRLYRKRDVEMALRIKSLLYDQGYTIPGARQVFKNEMKARETPAPATELAPALIAPAPLTSVAAAPARAEGKTAKIETRLRELRAEMESLLTILNGPADETSTPARTKPLRPRLVLQPNPAKPAPPKPELPRLQLAQRDLFGDASDTTE